MRDFQKIKKEMKVYVDGSLNGLDSAICVIRGKRKFTKVFDKVKNVEIIEFLAVIEGCKIAQNKETILTDSKPVYYALKLNKAGPEFVIYLKEAQMLINDKKLKIEWVRRDFNPAGVYLEKRLQKVKTSANCLFSNELNFLRRSRRFERKMRIYGKGLH